MNLKEPARESDTSLELPVFPVVPKIRGRILIGGVIQTSGFETREVRSSSHLPGEVGRTVLGETPNVDAAKFMEAVKAASVAWAKGRGDWPTARMEDRINAIHAFRDRMLKQREIVCRLLMWEIGKNWTDSQGEFDRTIHYIDETIEEVKRLDRDSSRFHFAGGLIAQIRRAPLGVTLCMGPFNYPLNETFRLRSPLSLWGTPSLLRSRGLVNCFGTLFLRLFAIVFRRVW